MVKLMDLPQKVYFNITSLLPVKPNCYHCNAVGSTDLKILLTVKKADEPALVAKRSHVSN